MIPVSHFVTRRLLRWAWYAALWAYPRGWISLRVFCRIDRAYAAHCVRACLESRP